MYGVTSQYIATSTAVGGDVCYSDCGANPRCLVQANAANVRGKSGVFRRGGRQEGGQYSEAPAARRRRPRCLHAGIGTALGGNNKGGGTEINRDVTRLIDRGDMWLCTHSIRYFLGSMHGTELPYVARGTMSAS